MDRPESRGHPRSGKPQVHSPLRILTAVPLCDGHDSAISTINLELVHAGVEVIYLGYHRAARDIVRAGIQEDVAAIGISSYNGGHVEFFADVVTQLRQRGAGHIRLFGGGGGTITRADAAAMQDHGVDRIFFAATPLREMADYVQRTYTPWTPGESADAGDADSDFRLARALTLCEHGKAPRHGSGSSGKAPRVVGITGPGGVGKTTLIDELILRMLRKQPEARIAILSHDPSLTSRGALLGDRAAMIYAQDDRVFMRSLATRGQAGGLSSATAGCLKLLRSPPLDRGFDLILVETVGIGQEAVPFEAQGIDLRVLVMSPDYGSRLQLQKISMIDRADVVVVNKSDLAGARTASAEMEQRVSMSGVNQPVISTVAKRHGDEGVDELFRFLMRDHVDAGAT